MKLDNSAESVNSYARSYDLQTYTSAFESALTPQTAPASQNMQRRFTHHNSVPLQRPASAAYYTSQSQYQRPSSSYSAFPPQSNFTEGFARPQPRRRFSMAGAPEETIHRLRAQRDGFEADVINLQAENGYVRADNEAFRERAATALKERDNALKANKALFKDTEALTRENEEQRSLIQRLMETVEGLREDRDFQFSERQRLVDRVNSLVQDVKDRNRALERSETKIDNLRAELRRYR